MKRVTGVARKKKTTKSEPAINPIQYIYSLLYGLGVAENPEKIVPNYTEDEKTLSIAVPSIRFGICFDGDDTQHFVDKGWTVEYVNSRDLEGFGRVFVAVQRGIVQKTKQSLDPNIKNTSQCEERLLDAILLRGLPAPDRNKTFYREDGTELTTPDFTWEEYKVAFFLDGAYWHSVVQDKEIIKKLKSNAKLKNQVVAERSDKVQKDNENRTQLTLMGYQVLVCSDKDVETDEGVQEQVRRIELLIENAKSAQELLAYSKKSKEDTSGENKEEVSGEEGQDITGDLDDLLGLLEEDVE